MTKILIVVTPHFNLAATSAFVDPFRVANYLQGRTRYHWRFAAQATACRASNGLAVETLALDAVSDEAFDMVVVSSSWTPEEAATPHLLAALRKWARLGCIMGAIDTGAFILADAGLLSGHRATVHYEHIDALRELHGDVDVSQDIFVKDETRFSCCGGLAAADMALQLIAERDGAATANAVARYVFHQQMRPPSTPQNPADREPTGSTVPGIVRQAIVTMEENLETVLPVAEICHRLGLSQRQLDRLFLRYVGTSPVSYYRDIRLDRARGLVTQTDMRMGEIAVACGFASAVYFSRAYRALFGISPRQDRVEGRIPFDFRAWPMHRRVDNR